MRPFELLKLFKLFALRTKGYTLILLSFLTFLPISNAYAAPQMADYCYLPPFVTDPNTPPNIIIAFDRTDDSKNRAYSTTYTASTSYYGFFDPASTYRFISASDYFVKDNTAACTANLTAANDFNCYSGNMLNWALMSSLDITRRALIGFGWAKNNPSAGNAWLAWDGTTGSLVSGGVIGADSNISAANVTVGASNFSYKVCLFAPSGQKLTTFKIFGASGATAPTSACDTNCNAANDCVGGTAGLAFSVDETRTGLIQKYADKNSDNSYDTDAPRFGMRRWKSGSGNDKHTDIIKDIPVPISAERADYFKAMISTTSSAPPEDNVTSNLGDMMHDIVLYFKDGGSPTYSDANAWSPSPYQWVNDPAKACRKNFALFISTGVNIPDTGTPLSPTCGTSDARSTTFSQDTCYAYNNNTADLSAQTGNQNIRTYVVHTTFYGAGAANEDKLRYAAEIGGGEYIKANDASTLQTKIEEAILNILSTSASASTVATLTTQTRESSTLTQAYFYPKREGTPLRWVGYLRLLWSDTGANLREDTENTGWLDLKKDKILSFYYDPGIDDPGIISYRARIYNPKTSPADPANYLKIDSCSSGSTTKKNDEVKAIWDAQSKLQTRSPDQADSDRRNIYIGVDGNNSGLVWRDEVRNFTTTENVSVSSSAIHNPTGTFTLPEVLKNFWNISSYCSNNTSRQCSNLTDCYYCATNTTRGCPGGTPAECSYCSLNNALTCSVLADCTFNYGACNLPATHKTCSVTSSGCTLDTDCPEGETCTGPLKGDCTLNAARYCSADADCVQNYGTCDADTCNTSGTCYAECDRYCAGSVVKYIRGFDKPTNTGSTPTVPGSTFRIRHQCSVVADCPGGQTCDAVSGLCSGSDVTKTLKLGDIVYSTPRISPNSAVNGYDVTYKDETYGNFVKSTTIKDATPIVIVGANDGMVHAFKVGKIKDLTGMCTTNDDCPSGETCESGVCSGGGYQTARFTDYPPTSDTGPPSDIGKELWAYIPWNAVPYLKWYCSESYCHIPMADARFTIVDASIDYDKNGSAGRGVTETRSATDTRTCNTDGTNCVWRRLLIGAMGVGGKKITVSRTFSSSIFVLDITDPTSPQVLWERRMPDDTLTTSTPAVVRLASAATDASKNENGKWYLVIGSGPESVTTNKLNYKTGNARIFVFDLITGDEAVSGGLDIGASGVAVGDMMAVDIDSDYQVDDIYFGTYGGTGASQTGKLYRLRIRDGSNYQTTPANWDIETVVNVGRPIYASAEIAQDALGNKWLYFGTGLYLTLEHAKATSDNEYLYGVKETEGCWKGLSTCPSVGSTTTPSYTTFLDTSGISFTGAKAVELGCFCAGSLMRTMLCESPGSCSGTCSSGEDTVLLKVQDATISGTGIPTSPTDCTSSPNNKDTSAIQCLTTAINASYNGWKRAITWQKSFSKPFVAGGLVDFTTFQPKSTVCSLGGDTYLYSLHYTTGTAYVQPTILACDKEIGCSSATTGIEIKALVNLGTGVPPLGESLVALPLSGDTYKVITQVSGGLPGTSMAPSLPARSGYVLWLVK